MHLVLRSRRHCPAQALAELGLVLPVLLVMLLGMIELGRGLVFGVAVQQGAREAARVGAVAALDATVTDEVVLQRFITASAPALVGCGPVLDSPQPCGGARWTFSIKVTAPGGSPTYASLRAARADAVRPMGGSRLQVTARGAVSLLAGLGLGAMVGGLGEISVQGDAVMVVL